MKRARQIIIVALTSILANPWAAAAQGACPSSNVSDVLKDPVVQAALDRAWTDSHEGQPDEHEEGGWIYQCRMPNVLDGTYRYHTEVRPWPPGTVDGIFETPPRSGDEACRLVADFHTHPGGGITRSGRPDNPGDDGRTNWEASPDDRRISAENGLPGIIRFGSGTDTIDFTYGYNGMQEPRDPIWGCPGDDASYGWGFGDPHVKTLDGYTYDFQAIGTFTYLASSRNDFEIQVQQQAYKDLGYASVNSAVAVRDGSDRVEWAMDRPHPLMNGVARPMDVGSQVKLRSRGALRRTEDGYLFISSVGDRLTIVVSSEMVDFYLRPAPHRRGKVRGLLGNFDGDVDNDLKTADGRVVALSAGVMDFKHPLYSQFGASWRVDAGNLMVSRAMPAVPDPQTFPGPEPEASGEAMAAARAKCEATGVTQAEARDACAFDLAATGNEAFVRSAENASQEVAARLQTIGSVLALNAEATGSLDGREARAVYTIRLTPGRYLLDSTGSERTSWTLASPEGAMLLTAEQGRLMGEEPTRVTIKTAGVYRIVVSVRFEMLDGRFRFKVSPTRP